MLGAIAIVVLRTGFSRGVCERRVSGPKVWRAAFVALLGCMRVQPWKTDWRLAGEHLVHSDGRGKSHRKFLGRYLDSSYYLRITQPEDPRHPLHSARSLLAGLQQCDNKTLIPHAYGALHGVRNGVPADNDITVLESPNVCWQ
jgi:hypothetical protein